MHTLFLSSEDSNEINISNNPSLFICELPYALELSSNHVCGLMEIRYNSIETEDLLIETDIIEYSYVNGKQLPVLRIVTEPSIYSHPYFFRIKQQRITRIKITITKKNGEFAPLTGVTSCVLKIKRIKTKK